jgi:hypothetical protein
MPGQGVVPTPPKRAASAHPRQQGIDFTQLFKGMSEARVSKMLEILSEGSQFNVNKFYGLYRGETNEEAQRFNTFFTQHNIQFLNGNNAKNFVIHSKPGTSPTSSIVLKLENRLGQPIDIEDKLRVC